MNTYIGIDLGTSAVKLLLTDAKGRILASVSKEYPLYFPRPGWSEQDPKDWIAACDEGMKELLCGQDASSVRGIGAAGQMHGLVILDKDGKVIRPAILWNDGRTEKQTAWLNEKTGKKKLSELTANIAFAGFTAPKLLWLAENEPDSFSRIDKIMLPKDLINYYLTGVHCCDYSDASGMLLLDVKDRCWSEEMLRICGVRREQLPELYESYETVGTLRKELAERFGLSPDVRVCAGAGDNAAAAVGTGTVGNGACNISIGTSGTIFISQRSFSVDTNNALHSFAHADGGYHLMGCMLSAASCNKWLCEDILGTEDYAKEQADITDEDLGRSEVFFLPYLMGERSPINDTDARGTFTGLTLGTRRKDLVLAVMEGVAFALRDSFEVAKSLGLDIKSSCLCGGGAKSPLWRKVIANILGIPLKIPFVEEGPGYGAAMLAMCACGEYENVGQCASSLTGVSQTVFPDEKISARYEERYQRFKKIYPAMRPLFKELGPAE